MQIQYLSAAEEAWFSNMIHDNGDLGDLFATFIVKADIDTDYDTITVSFDEEGVLRIVIEESPYMIVLDENDRSLELYVMKDDGEHELDGEYDFDEDGIETIVDIISSRVLDDEFDAFQYR